MNQSKLLIIDDLGAERGTDYSLERVYDIIDSRYRSNKPIILTTNLTMEQMKNCEDIRYNGDTDLCKARTDIIDELADVRIMCRQMELLFQAEDEVERRIDFKVDRQLKRLEG